VRAVVEGFDGTVVLAAPSLEEVAVDRRVALPG
jgi:hypothetical protein